MSRGVLLFRVVLLTVTATGLVSRAVADEQTATASIEKLGGTVRPIAANDESKDVDFHLSGQGLTDEGLAHVSQLDKVVWLNLKDTAISDAGLQHLSGLSDLKTLHLERTAITDRGLAHLANLSKIEYLNLNETKVHDHWIEHLAGLKNLKRLYLWKSEVTEEGADKLKQSLPDLVVNLGAELTPVIIEPVEGPQSETDGNETAPEETLAEGQFLRVRLEGEGQILTLAEVEVIETGTGNKLQSDGTASQSSVDYGAEANRAIDGNSAQAFGKNSVTHTRTEDYPWWTLDLGKSADVGRIKIWNRSDCCGERLEGAIVELLDADRNIVWSDSIEEASDGSVHEFVNQQ